MLLITFQPSLPHAGSGLVETYEICFLPKSAGPCDASVSHQNNSSFNADNYIPAKPAERRGRSCAGPQTMFDIFIKRLGHYLWAGTRPPLRSISNLRNLNSIYLICRIILWPRAILCFHSSWAHGHYEPTENIRCAFILPWGQSSFLRMSKLCSCGIEAIFLWGWSHVPVGLKLCSQCCNAIEKDCSLRSEWLEPTQRTFVRQAAKANVENGYVLPSWQNKD